MSRPANFAELRESGWISKTVKQEIYDNFLAALARGEDLFPGIIGYDSTVIPEISIALLAGHDMLFLGEKGQAKSRLMRLLPRFLDPEIPYLDVPEAPVARRPLPAADRAPARRFWPSTARKRCRSPGGGARIAMPNGWRREPSSPT